MHNATDPWLFNLFGFLGFFWLVWVLVRFVLVYFFSFSPLSIPAPSVCIYLYSYLFLLLLPKHLPPPLTCAPFWLFQFTDSRPAPHAEESEENVHLCPDFIICQVTGAWRRIFLFDSDAAQWKPSWTSPEMSTPTWRCTLVSNKRVSISAWWLPFGETADHVHPLLRNGLWTKWRTGTHNLQERYQNQFLVTSA